MPFVVCALLGLPAHQQKADDGEEVGVVDVARQVAPPTDWAGTGCGGCLPPRRRIALQLHLHRIFEAAVAAARTTTTVPRRPPPRPDAAEIIPTREIRSTIVILPTNATMTVQQAQEEAVIFTVRLL